MLASWVLSIGFFAVVGAAPLLDDQFSEKLNKSITDVNYYIEDHSLAESRLPDLGHFDFEPLKLTGGSFGEFDTLVLKGNPTVKERTNQDGTTTYDFDAEVGLEKLSVRYDYSFSLLGSSSSGNVSISVQDNSVELKGIVVSGNKYCDARLDSFGLAKLGQYKFEVRSDDNSTHIVKILKGFMSPVILNLINDSLDGFLVVSPIQDRFRELLCKQFQQ